MAIWGEKDYIPNIMGASGITKEQAKTCMYYAMLTYAFIGSRVKLMPILNIQGPVGTGKSNLLRVLRQIVYDPREIKATSFAGLRDELISGSTAIMDEASYVDEDLLVKRYQISTAKVSFKKRAICGWTTEKTDIFGSTIIVRSVPFVDLATRSRSITINTKYRPGDYKVVKLDREQFEKKGG